MELLEERKDDSVSLYIPWEIAMAARVKVVKSLPNNILIDVSKL